MDSDNLQPLSSASIYGENDELLGTSDRNGFFNVAIKNEQAGEIFFDLKVEKAGYKSFEQKEHWGDLDGDQLATFYFGSQNDAVQGSKSFSHLLPGIPNNYTAVSTMLERFLSEEKAGKKN